MSKVEVQPPNVMDKRVPDDKLWGSSNDPSVLHITMSKWASACPSLK
jgi:hypothetical protein